MRHLPTSGGGPALTQLLGGHVDMTAGGPAALSAQIKAGKVRGLAEVVKAVGRVEEKK